jgi:tetratricopeptide (TPR) repeat protein
MRYSVLFMSLVIVGCVVPEARAQTPNLAFATSSRARKSLTSTIGVPLPTASPKRFKPTHSLRESNHLELALKDFDTAIELDPGIGEAYVNRGLILILFGRETEAARDLKKGMELKPEAKADIEKRAELAKRLIRDGAAVAKQ